MVRENNFGKKQNEANASYWHQRSDADGYLDFQNNDGEFRIYGSFGELFDTENEVINQSGYENVFNGNLALKVPGEITKPNISNIVENTIIFEADGVSSKTFELISSNDRPLNPINIAVAFVVLTAVYFFVRQSRKTK